MVDEAAERGLDIDRAGAKKQSKRLLTVPVSGRNERVRRWMAYLIFIVYILLIFEGVLRKWALPGMHSILFFIRDPFVLATYILAIKYKMWPRWTPIFSVGCLMAAAFIPLAVVQSALSNLSPIITIYGWRNYFYYLPFAFIIGEQFRGRDLSRLCRYTLLAAIPIAVLCYQQFRSPPDDILNESLGGTQAMLVSHGIVRTSGTFTIAAAQTLFIGSVIAMLLTVWLLPRKWRPLNYYELVLSSFAAMTSFAVSGSRSVLLQAAMIAAGAFSAIMIIYRNRPRLRSLFILPAIAVAGGLIFMTVFHTSYQAMLDRQEAAQAVEGNSLYRITASFTGIVSQFQHVSLLGQGLGSATNAAYSLSAGPNFVMGEDEWSRIILEAGVVGVFYVLYRIWLVYYLFRGAVAATRRSRNPIPIIFFSFIALALLNGQITLQGTINGYGWLFAGFCMAANRLATRKSKEDGLWS